VFDTCRMEKQEVIWLKFPCCHSALPRSCELVDKYLLCREGWLLLSKYELINVFASFLSSHNTRPHVFGSFCVCPQLALLSTLPICESKRFRQTAGPHQDKRTTHFSACCLGYPSSIFAQQSRSLLLCRAHTSSRRKYSARNPVRDARLQQTTIDARTIQ
jgi:hypothetical protein